MPCSQVSPLMVDAIPHDDTHSLAFQLACLKEQAATAPAQALRTRATARSGAWSPAGCSPDGGCLLAVTTDDGKVPPSCFRKLRQLLLLRDTRQEPRLIVMHECLQARVFGPPIGAVDTQWEVQTDLSEQLHTFLRDNNWLVRLIQPRAVAFSCHFALSFLRIIWRLIHGRLPLQESSGDAGSREPLRLRGGGMVARKAKSAPQAQAAAASGPIAPSAAARSAAPGAFGDGARVEVMNDEDGLRGCW